MILIRVTIPNCCVEGAFLKFGLVKIIIRIFVLNLRINIFCLMKVQRTIWKNNLLWSRCKNKCLFKFYNLNI